MRGLITDNALNKKILNRFIGKFVKNDYTFKDLTTGGIKLIWCNFREVHKVYATDELFGSQLQIDVPIYFYNERTQEIFLTDFEDVRNFINNLEPWEEIDAEIFDESLEWVIAVTHEDVSIVSGLNVAIDEYDYEKDISQYNSYFS